MQVDAILQTSNICFEEDFKCFSLVDYLEALDQEQLWINFQQLRNSFFNLTLDKYMNDGGKYRLRRFGKFELNRNLNKLMSVNDTSFYQSKSVNSLNGGSLRTFDALEAETIENPLLKQIIFFHLNRIDSRLLPGLINIYVHQIRILANATDKGLPTPEGIHRDGHDFVAQVLINRNNISGGMSRLYDSNQGLVLEKTLKAPFDTVLINDQKMYHEVTPLWASTIDQNSYRDMLLIDFNFSKTGVTQ
jgi:hypothetical protein